MCKEKKITKKEMEFAVKQDNLSKAVEKFMREIYGYRQRLWGIMRETKSKKKYLNCNQKKKWLKTILVEFEQYDENFFRLEFNSLRDNRKIIKISLDVSNDDYMKQVTETLALMNELENILKTTEEYKEIAYKAIVALKNLKKAYEEYAF